MRQKTPKGEKCPVVIKWDVSIIRRICELLSENKYTTKDIAMMTGTNRQLVTSIATKTTWIDISDEYPNIKPTSLVMKNSFVKFHDWIDSMIILGVSRNDIIDKLKSEGLSSKESYNLLYGRIRKNERLRKRFYEINPYNRKSSTTIPCGGEIPQ